MNNTQYKKSANSLKTEALIRDPGVINICNAKNGIVDLPAEFMSGIKVLLIPKAFQRICAHFLNFNDVADLKSCIVNKSKLIGLLMQEQLKNYMKEKGYLFVGEFLLTNDGNLAPTINHSWTIKGKTISFTKEGLLFFTKVGGSKKDNVVMIPTVDDNSGIASITCYSESEEKSKSLIDDLVIYAKRNNALRGAKLRDINVSNGEFAEVIIEEKYNWNQYFFPKSIQSLFNVEVFSFLQDIKKYNQYGIFKRGLLFYGRPGTGKTTLGKLISRYSGDITVLWITPDAIVENNNSKMSIKNLYELADYVGPSIIILEDLDLFSEDRDNQQGNFNLGALMNILDGINAIKNIVTIGTTNRLELIESALSNRPGRFDRVVAIDNMHEPERRAMFENRFVEFKYKVDKDAFEYLIKESDGWSAAQCNGFIEAVNLKLLYAEKRIEQITKDIVSDVLHNAASFSLQQSQKKGAGFN